MKNFQLYRTDFDLLSSPGLSLNDTILKVSLTVRRLWGETFTYFKFRKVKHKKTDSISPVRPGVNIINQSSLQLHLGRSKQNTDRPELNYFMSLEITSQMRNVFLKKCNQSFVKVSSKFWHSSTLCSWCGTVVMW